jgi:succinate dehydrogenase hydrophobic anchor subunit
MFFLLTTTILFFLAGIRDMKRRSFILNQLGQYLSPKKLQIYKTKKLLPTINFLDQVSLHTWIDLRKLSIDYGKKYFFRHEMFMPVVFQLAVICLLIVFFILS